MAKKQPKGPPAEPTVTVKIWASIHRQAKLVAYQRGVDISDLLSEMLQKPIAQAYQKAAAEIAKDAKSEGDSPG